MTIVPSEAGALLTINTKDSRELDFGDQIVDAIKANLRNGKNRVFSQDKKANTYLITSGLRSKPTNEEVMAILDEVYKAISQKTEDLGLTVGKRVTL